GGGAGGTGGNGGAGGGAGNGGSGGDGRGGGLSSTTVATTYTGNTYANNVAGGGGGGSMTCVGGSGGGCPGAGGKGAPGGIGGGGGAGAGGDHLTPGGGADGVAGPDGAVGSDGPVGAAAVAGAAGSGAYPDCSPPTCGNTNPGTPATPTITGAGAGSFTLSWIKPNGANVPTDYEISIYAGPTATLVSTAKTGSTGTSKVLTVPGGDVYRATVKAFTPGGEGAPSAMSAYVLPPFKTIDAFTNQQYLDFQARAASSAELSAWRNVIAAGTSTPVGRLDTQVMSTRWQQQSPVIRLFRAYFLRLPDLGGLNYWTNKRRAGKSLDWISQSFASSSEFKNRYGTLSNAAFVNLVYTNVLGRAGDPGGVSHWTGVLDKGTKTRGQVMLGFSESNEYKTKTTALVDTVNVFTGMLRRIPTAAEATTWGPTTGAPPRTSLITALLISGAYDART
ncbi:MAG: hypothetical protein JWM89_2336, partial [Acidimicrobiales bacterium]|nr:hypothetical protein [Acidimicrobiales bacterium]